MAVTVVALIAGGGMMTGISPEVSPQASAPESDASSARMSYTFSFSEPTITQDNWLHVILDNCTPLQHEDEPMLPHATHTITFPLGTQIRDVQVTIKGKKTQPLNEKIAPAPRMMPTNKQHQEQIQKPGPIYKNTNLYPPQWLDWRTGAGLHHGEHVTFLTLQAFPARYAPQANLLHVVDSIQAAVSYEMPAEPLLNADVYDLLIIAPREFSRALQPLVEHKENHGVDTMLVTLEEVYKGYYFGFGGRDHPEQVKYFIKHALEDWGVSYVLLMGGRRGGLREEQWWCPVRYSNLDDGSDEHQYLSDLYFADIYQQQDGEEIAFASWDTNHNGVFAEWKDEGRDMLDMYPDVAVGRLACRNILEVQMIVEKIITYEATASGSTWARRFVGIAGDTYPASGEPSYYEGELATAAAFSFLEDYEADFVWTSTETMESADDIVRAINQGAGFLHFSGHGSPMDWATHRPQHRGWIHFDVSQFHRLSNEDMYPVAVVGGCHNNQFNVSLLNLLKLGQLPEVIDDQLFTPECWGWWLTRKFDGGAIATIANTGYGYGQPGEDCLEKRGRYMELMFFQSYAEGNDRLGLAHAQDQTYYLHAFPPMDDRKDCKIVQQWTLLGDPSLKIGGYP